MYQACRFGREIAKSIPSELSMLQKCTERKDNADVDRKLNLPLS